MSAAIEQVERMSSATAVVATMPANGRFSHDTAIDSRPLVGGEINIRIALSPGTVTLLAGPVTALLTMLAGWILLTTAGLPLYRSEMFAGGLVTTLGGVAAAFPLFVLMKRGASAIAQAAILGIALRCGVVLMGLLIAMATPWGLAKMPLVYWILAYYAPLLIVETAVVAWLSNKARH